MIHDHDDFVYLRSPAAWGRPPFQLGDRVYAKTTDNPGTVTGVMFVDRHIESLGELVTDQGWWFEIKLDETARLAAVCPRELLHSTVIQPFRDSVQSRYELAAVV
jgi:hypothetical protein